MESRTHGVKPPDEAGCLFAIVTFVCGKAAACRGRTVVQCCSLCSPANAAGGHVAAMSFAAKGEVQRKQAPTIAAYSPFGAIARTGYMLAASQEQRLQASTFGIDPPALEPVQHWDTATVAGR